MNKAFFVSIFIFLTVLCTTLTATPPHLEPEAIFTCISVARATFYSEFLVEQDFIAEMIQSWISSQRQPDDMRRSLEAMRLVASVRCQQDLNTILNYTARLNRAFEAGFTAIESHHLHHQQQQQQQQSFNDASSVFDVTTDSLQLEPCSISSLASTTVQMTARNSSKDEIDVAATLVGMSSASTQVATAATAAAGSKRRQQQAGPSKRRCPAQAHQHSASEVVHVDEVVPAGDEAVHAADKVVLASRPELAVNEHENELSVNENQLQLQDQPQHQNQIQHENQHASSTFSAKVATVKRLLLQKFRDLGGLFQWAHEIYWHQITVHNWPEDVMFYRVEELSPREVELVLEAVDRIVFTRHRPENETAAAAAAAAMYSEACVSSLHEELLSTMRQILPGSRPISWVLISQEFPGVQITSAKPKHWDNRDCRKVRSIIDAINNNMATAVAANIRFVPQIITWRRHVLQVLHKRASSLFPGPCGRNIPRNHIKVEKWPRYVSSYKSAFWSHEDVRILFKAIDEISFSPRVEAVELANESLQRKLKNDLSRLFRRQKRDFSGIPWNRIEACDPSFHITGQYFKCWTVEDCARIQRFIAEFGSLVSEAD